jgi:hypothetical protein
MILDTQQDELGRIRTGGLRRMRTQILGENVPSEYFNIKKESRDIIRI